MAPEGATRSLTDRSVSPPNCNASGRASRPADGAMAKPGPARDEITVILPPEPPELNPEAARVLLRILLKAYEKQFGHEYSPAAEN